MVFTRFIRISFFLLFLSLFYPVCSNANTLQEMEPDSVLSLVGILVNKDPQQALHISDSLLKDNDLGCRDQAWGHYYAGLSANYLGKYGLATTHLKLSIEKAERCDKGRIAAGSLQALGLVQENQGLLEEAVDSYVRSHDLFDECGDVMGKARSLTNIGCVLMRKKDFSGGYTYFNKSLSISLAEGDENLMALNYNNLGILSSISGKQDEALDYYNKAYEIHDAQGKDRLVAKLLNNMALIYDAQQKYEQALKHYKKSVAIKKRLKDREGMGRTYNSIAKLYLKQDMSDSAYLYGSLALEIGKNYSNWEILSVSNDLLAGYYESRKDYLQALSYYKRAKVSHDSLYNIRVSQQIAEMQARFEVKEEEKRNALLSEQVSHQRTWLFMAGIVVTVALVMLFVLYRMFRFRSLAFQKTKTILKQEKEMSKLIQIKQDEELRRLESEKKQKEYENRLLESTIEHNEKIARLEKEKMQATVDAHNRELASLTVNLIATNDILRTIDTDIQQTLEHDQKQWYGAFKNLQGKIKSQVNPELTWVRYKKNLEEAYPGFFDRLLQSYPELTDTEQKLCAYLRVNLQSKEIAQTMNVSVSAVSKGRQRLRKKLNLEAQGNIYEFLQAL